jgi:formamidopyrimidine-DNA glycosylase
VSRKDMVHGDPRPLGELLPDRCVKRVRRRAKRVIVDLDDGTELVFRLGMSGQLMLADGDEPPEPHTHLRIAVPDLDCELRFRDPRRFGGVWCLTGGSKTVGRPLGEVGPEPLDTTPAEFRRILQRRRQIKALLMDQHVIAGLGNIYCDEALHAARIHPLTCANALDAATADRLLRAVKRTLRAAIRFNGSTFMDYRRADGTEGSFQKHHRVYQRHGEPCRTCGTRIRRIHCAGRSTFLCPECQPRRREKSKRPTGKKSR